MENNLTLEHEYQLTGLVPGYTSIMKLDLYSKNGIKYCAKRFEIYVPELNNMDYL